MKLLLAVAVGVVAVASLAGQTAQPTKPVLGAGATLCREFSADKVVRNPDGSWTSSDSPKDPVKVSWILGYLSAAGVSGKAAQPGGGGEAYIIGWVSSACVAQPQRTLAEIVAEFGR